MCNALKQCGVDRHRLARDIYRAGGVTFEQRIREADDVGFRCSEDGVERSHEILIGRVVGPEREDDGKLVYIYPTGAKKRLKPLTSEKAAEFDSAKFLWMFGKPDALWRGDRLLHCTETVHITEGETAAISLIDAGIDNGTTEIVMATAGASSWRDEWVEMFRRRKVVIWPDADDADDKLKQRIIQSLSHCANAIEVVPTQKGVKL